MQVSQSQGKNAVIKAGLYWLRKSGNDVYELSNGEDLEKAKREHTVEGSGEDKDLRLAVNIITTNELKSNKPSKQEGS